MKDFQKACAIVGTITIAGVAAVLAIKGIHGWGWFVALAFCSLGGW